MPAVISPFWVFLCSTLLYQRAFSSGFFGSKNKLCLYGIWLQTNSLPSCWFYEAIGFKMHTTDLRVFVYWGVLLPAVS